MAGILARLLAPSPSMNLNAGIDDIMKANGLPSRSATIGGIPQMAGMGGAPLAPDQMAVPTPDISAPTVPHPGFFQEGGTFQKLAPLLGTIGDILATRSGGEPAYANMMKLRQSQQDAQLDRAYKMAQIQNLLHPRPNNDYDRLVSRFGQEAGDNYLRNAEAGPPMAIDQVNPVTHLTERTYAYRNQLPGVAPQSGTMPGSASAGPKPGTVIDGYRFKGGNPNDQNNWESALPAGGANPIGSPIFPDPMKAPGTMTSGRRTVRGNAAVGGVPHSHHLDGDAADYVGATPAALATYFGPNARILNEGNHVHVTLPGYGRVPYYGARGTMGL
jgi:hypothetical protein